MATIRVNGFEWDPLKAAANEKKHGVTFVEALECFLDPFGVDVADASYPDRIILIAVSRAERILFVVYTERAEGAILRIISARRATRHEKAFYKSNR